MRLFSFIKKRLLHRFILVYQSDVNVSVQVYDIKNKEIVNQNSEEFVLDTKDEFSTDLINYINTFQEEVVRSYVVTLVNSQGQGIIPTCSASEFKKYSVDRRYIYNICIDNRFTNYVSKIEIKWIQKLFEKTGIDLIFSPFLILKDLAQNEKETLASTILYILYINHSASIMIKNDDNFLYGAFYNTTKDENLLYCDFDKDEESVDEEEFEIDDDIEIDDENEDFEIDEELDEEEEDEINEVELIEENKTFTKFLSNSLKEFYSNPIYSGTFVDAVHIYSEEKLDKSVIEFMENELFLSTKHTLIELDPLVLKYAQKEVIGV